MVLAAGRVYEDAKKNTRDDLAEALSSSAAVAALLGKVSFIARARYGILLQEAEDIFHEAVATYLEIQGRYSPKDNHFGILVGVFHKKCLEFLEKTRRNNQISELFIGQLLAEEPVRARGEDPSGSTIDQIVRDEDSQIIVSTIHRLNGRIADIVAMGRKEKTRKECVARIGNPNTADTRFRAQRAHLRMALRDAGYVPS